MFFGRVGGTVSTLQIGPHTQFIGGGRLQLRYSGQDCYCSPFLATKWVGQQFVGRVTFGPRGFRTFTRARDSFFVQGPRLL